MTFMEVVERMLDANLAEVEALDVILKTRHSTLLDEVNEGPKVLNAAEMAAIAEGLKKSSRIDQSEPEPPLGSRKVDNVSSFEKAMLGAVGTSNAETNAHRHITRQRRASARRAKLEANAPFAYEPEAPWAKKMWRRLQRTAKATGEHRHLSVEQLAKEVGAAPKLVGMALYTLYQKPNTPVVRVKRGASYFYGVES